jgi:hypothetical protein
VARGHDADLDDGGEVGGKEACWEAESAWHLCCDWKGGINGVFNAVKICSNLFGLI